MKDHPRQYATAAAFRVALETRLKSIAAAEGADLQRLRRQVSFISLPANATTGFGEEILVELQRSARADLEDFFQFTIAEPQMNLDAAPQGERGTR